MRRIILTASLLAALPSFAAAHDVWLTLEGAGKAQRAVVNYGHPGDRPPAFVDKIVQFDSIGASETRSLRDELSMASQNGVIIARSKLLAQGEPKLFAARYDNGFWVRTGETSLNITRRSMPNAGEAVWSGKFAKAVSGPGAPWSRVIGYDLEIVPLSDPALATVGQSQRIKVLFKGNPLANAQIERGDGIRAMAEDKIPRFQTNADGEAQIPILQSGPTLLVVDHRTSPSQSPDQADLDLYCATFWFKAAR